jgi:hypothetical protein
MYRIRLNIYGAYSTYSIVCHTMARISIVAQALRDAYPDHAMFIQHYLDGNWRDCGAVNEHGHIEWHKALGLEET